MRGIDVYVERAVARAFRDLDRLHEPSITWQRYVETCEELERVSDELAALRSRQAAVPPEVTYDREYAGWGKWFVCLGGMIVAEHEDQSSAVRTANRLEHALGLAWPTTAPESATARASLWYPRGKNDPEYIKHEAQLAELGERLRLERAVVEASAALVLHDKKPATSIFNVGWHSERLGLHLAWVAAVDAHLAAVKEKP